ncbi:MAG: Hachiman antiphage defense system protein HamA [Alistipes communis]
MPLVETIRRVIPEYALGYHVGYNIPQTEIVDRLQEAAKTVYTTDKYKKRGEFGELILHLLLRDFCNTIPLFQQSILEIPPMSLHMALMACI